MTKFELEIPEDWIKTGRQWTTAQIMSCSQCPYKTPSAALYVTHVYTQHGSAEKEEETLILDK